MIGSNTPHPTQPRRRRFPAHWLLPVALGGLVLLAAPFYGRVMERLLWMGQTVRALCGF